MYNLKTLFCLQILIFSLQFCNEKEKHPPLPSSETPKVSGTQNKSLHKTKEDINSTNKEGFSKNENLDQPRFSQINVGDEAKVPNQTISKDIENTPTIASIRQNPVPNMHGINPQPYLEESETSTVEDENSEVVSEQKTGPEELQKTYIEDSAEKKDKIDEKSNQNKDINLENHDEGKNNRLTEFEKKLFEAVKTQQSIKVNELLNSSDSIPITFSISNSIDKNNLTLLHYPCMYGNLNIFRSLMERLKYEKKFYQNKVEGRKEIWKFINSNRPNSISILQVLRNKPAANMLAEKEKEKILKEVLEYDPSRYLIKDEERSKGKSGGIDSRKKPKLPTSKETLKFNFRSQENKVYDCLPGLNVLIKCTNCNNAEDKLIHLGYGEFEIGKVVGRFDCGHCDSEEIQPVLSELVICNSEYQYKLCMRVNIDGSIMKTFSNNSKRKIIEERGTIENTRDLHDLISLINFSYYLNIDCKSISSP